eukprot:TRINITY_DN19967_c0_g1_i1.p1 TRINITY_DN19967_c0_g1~~TRINITY_DN19967_c0_g1_i1.p1  ORF type:complete len:349 (-),score=105.49 TRINITY_DN19967_c0_g1_i1:58-1035(-)
MAAGIIAQLPGGEVQHVPMPAPKLLLEGSCLSEVASRLRRLVLSPALGIIEKAACADDQQDDKNLEVKSCEDTDCLPQAEEDEVDDDYRILFRGRDLEDESIAAAFLENLESGRPCMVRVLFRLLGGKGGFGSLLKNQKGGKKTTNFDAMRDLNGRRIRHVKAVERIKDWLEQKKREDEIVKMLTGEGPELPKPTAESESLDPNFVRKLKSAAASRPALVSEGLRHLLNETDDAELPEEGEEVTTKRARTDSSAASSSSQAGSAAKAASAPSKDSPADDGDSVNWLGALDSLGGLSSPDSDDKEDEPPAGSAASSSSSAGQKASG